MSQVQIRSIITTALAAWAASKSIPLLRENVSSFEKPVNFGTFLELNIIPANTFLSNLEGTGRRFLGEVIINIWHDDGTGTGPAEALAEEIAQLFPVVPKSYLPVSIETPVSIKRGIVNDDGYRVLPVCFYYRAEF